MKGLCQFCRKSDFCPIRKDFFCPTHQMIVNCSSFADIPLCNCDLTFVKLNDYTIGFEIGTVHTKASKSVRKKNQKNFTL